MKIKQLDLLAFGPFENKTLDLGEGNAGLVVIYGDNEAGKSSALRATTGLLYGIDERTTDDHLHEKSQLRIGGHLVHSDGSEIRFTRRKGRKETLLHPDDGRVIDDADLVKFQGGVDEKLFGLRPRNGVGG